MAFDFLNINTDEMAWSGKVNDNFDKVVDNVGALDECMDSPALNDILVYDNSSEKYEKFQLASGYFDINGTSKIITPIIPTGATGSRPGTPLTGQQFYDTAIAKLIVYDGLNWVDAMGAIS